MADEVDGGRRRPEQLGDGRIAGRAADGGQRVHLVTPRKTPHDQSLPWEIMLCRLHESRLDIFRVIQTTGLQGCSVKGQQLHAVVVIHDTHIAN